MNNCDHANIRKVIHITADVPVGHNTITKTSLRSGAVHILGVDWDATIIYCGDCGLLFKSEDLSIYDAIMQKLTVNQLMDSKFNRVKAVWQLFDKKYLLFTVKQVVEKLYTNDGYGVPALKRNTTLDTVKQMLENMENN